MKKKFFALTLGLVLTAGTWLPSPALASSTDLALAHSVVDSLPEIVPNVSPFSESGAVSAENSASLEPSEGMISYETSNPDPNANSLAFRISPNYSGSGVAFDKELAVSESPSNRTTFIGQVDAENIRIIASSDSAPSASDIEYSTSLPSGSYLLKAPDGSYKALSQNGEYLGEFNPPWAIDALGVPLQTSFALEGNLLHQYISVTPEVNYPVVSDPSWGYSIDISVHLSFLLGLPVETKSTHSASYVTSLLKSCFSCYFPVGGAPTTYPYVGQSMPLVIRNPITGVMMPAAVKVDSVFNYGWSFVALPGHIDGVGSSIKFTWYRDASGYLHLAVDAAIVRANPCGFGTDPTCHQLYVSQAYDSWQTLFNNVT